MITDEDIDTSQMKESPKDDIGIKAGVPTAVVIIVMCVVGVLLFVAYRNQQFWCSIPEFKKVRCFAVLHVSRLESIALYQY